MGGLAEGMSEEKAARETAHMARLEALITVAGDGKNKRVLPY